MLQKSRGPFTMLERFADEIDHAFDPLRHGWPGWRRQHGLLSSKDGGTFWAPDIEVRQRHNELVVRADLPGMKKDDVQVDVNEDGITIQGERRQEQETDRDGVYRSERSYGSFYRTIPIPEGAMTDQAKATFKNGVLEITMPAPPAQVAAGRRLPIEERAGEPNRKGQER